MEYPRLRETPFRGLPEYISVNSCLYLDLQEYSIFPSLPPPIKAGVIRQLLLCRLSLICSNLPRFVPHPSPIMGIDMVILLVQYIPTSYEVKGRISPLDPLGGWIIHGNNVPLYSVGTMPIPVIRLGLCVYLPPGFRGVTFTN
jgi:hypothetical protein